MQAYANQRAKAKKGSDKNPKPVYTTFESFYDYEKAQESVRIGKEKQPDQFARLKQYLRKGGNSSG